jgi:hypothetical protein
MAKDPNEFVKLARTGKHSGGGWFYLNSVCLEKALKNVGLPYKGTPLKVKQYAMKGKKNVAQIVLEIRVDTFTCDNCEIEKPVTEIGWDSMDVLCIDCKDFHP